MLYRKLKTTLKLMFVLLIVFAAIAVTLHILAQNPSVQNYLLEHLGETIGYKFRAKKIDVWLWRGIGFDAYDVVARPLAGNSRMEAPKFRVLLDITELIQGRILPARIFVSRPNIELFMKKGTRPSEDFDNLVLIKKMTAGGLPSLRYYSVEQGNMRIEGFPFEMKQVDFTAYPEKGTPGKVTVKMRGRAVSGKIEVPFSLQGAASSDGGSAHNLCAEMTLKAGKFPLSWIPCPATLPFSEGAGDIDIKLKVAHGGSVSAEGKLFAENVRFSVVRHERRKNYSFNFLEIDIASRYSEKVFEIPSFRLKGPDFTASADSKLDFRDKSNPHIYFRVKTPFMPLATLKRIIPTSLIPQWVEEELFPILSGGQARVDHYSMNGALAQYRDLRQPENSGVLSTKVELKDFDVYENAGALPFEKVSGEFSIENGALSTTVTNAAFGNSTLTKASLDIDNIYGKHTNSIAGEGLFDLEDLRQQEKLCPMPQDVRKKIQAFQTASGEVKGQIQIDFNEDWTCPRIIEGNFLGRNCLLVHEDLFLPLSLDEAEALIDAGVGNRFQGTGRWGRSEFQASGSTDSQWEDAKVQIDAWVRMNEMMNRFNKGQQLHLEYKDLVPLQATLSGMEKAWACQGSLNPGCVTLNTDAVHVDPPGKDDKVVFDLEFYPDEKVNLKRMRCDLGKSAIEMTGSWNLKDKGGTNFEALTQDLHLEDLGIRFKKQKVPVGGVISCNVAIQKAPEDSSSSLSLTGTAVGKDVSFTLEKMSLPIHDCHFKLDFSEKDAFIHSLGMGMGQSTVSINGQLKGWNGLTGSLDIDAEYLDLSELIFDGIEPKDVKPAPGPFIKKSNIQLNLIAHKGQWKKLSFSPLRAEGILRSGDLFIKRADAHLEHGTFSLKGHVKSTDGPERIFLVSKTQLENQPVDDFLYSFGLEKKALDGALTMDGWVSTKGNRKKDLISGLQGNAHVQVGKGHINSPYGLFYKILNVLSLQNIFKGRLPDLSKEAFPFDHIDARFTARDGILETDDFSIKSPVLNLVAPGKIDLVKEHIDVVVWVQTLETMDSVISKVPIIGYILTEKECAPKGILLYPVEVKGLLSDPKIKYRPSLLRLGSGVFNIFKRILNIPAHYFKKISGWGKEEEENVVLPPDFGTELECKEVENETLDNSDK